MVLTLATVDEFLQTFPALEVVALSDLDNPQRLTADTDRIQKALEDATSEILLKLGNLPATDEQITALKTNTPRSVRWCLEIARYLLDTYAAREEIRTRYRDVIAQIKEYYEATVTGELPGADGNVPRPAIWIV